MLELIILLFPVEKIASLILCNIVYVGITLIHVGAKVGIIKVTNGKVITADVKTNQIIALDRLLKKLAINKPKEDPNTLANISIRTTFKKASFIPIVNPIIINTLNTPNKNMNNNLDNKNSMIVPGDTP
ncbi:MAG: hypothetical protein MJB12_21060 [Firmicutes bacterium]|nr:hypothetical protein [Bacillota bacterium]